MVKERPLDPPEEPDPRDTFPWTCECGFTAWTVDEMDDHKHPADWFVRGR